jgi:hypothetical protein
MGVAASLWAAETAHAGSARDYLNAPVDTWLLNYNAGHTTSVTPEDGTDTIPGVRSNVLAQSVVLTRIMDYWGRTGGFSLVLPFALIDTSAGPFRASTNGVSDVGFLWQMNIFGGPALTREQFQSFIPQTGVVTLSKRRREAGLPCETSGGRDDLAPRGHRRGAKHAVRLS